MKLYRCDLIAYLWDLGSHSKRPLVSFMRVHVSDGMYFSCNKSIFLVANVTDFSEVYFWNSLKVHEMECTVTVVSAVHKFHLPIKLKLALTVGGGVIFFVL